MRVPGRVSKVKQKLRVGLGELDKAIEAETKSMLDPQQAKKRETEIRDMFFTARKKTKGLQTGILMGMFGEDVGQALANVFAKEDPSKVKAAQSYFKKYQQSENKQKNLRQKQLKEVGKLIGKQRLPMQQGTPQLSNNIEMKEGFYYDPRVGARGGIRNVRTGRLASKEEATSKRKETTDRLTKAIGADEEPLVLLRERFDQLFKSVGVDNRGKTVHEKLDELIEQIESGDGGFDFTDLLGLRGGRRGPKTKGPKTKGSKPKGKIASAAAATRKFFGGQQGRDAKGRFTKKGGGGGGLGMRGLLAGGLGAAAGGYLGYNAVDMFRDKDVNIYDPEALKQDAIAARQAGDTEYSEALKTQIELQKTDVQYRAGAEVAGAATAAGGAYAGTKVAEKIGKTSVGKKVSDKTSKITGKAKDKLKEKTWDLFIKFLEKRAPTLFAKVSARLATAGALATIPVAGWIGAAISLGFTLSTVYDLYQLWKEFSALSDAEKELAAKPEPPKTQTSTTAAPPSAATRASTSIGGPFAARVAPTTSAVAPAKPPTEEGFFSKAGSAIKSAAISVADTVGSFFGMESSDPMNADLEKYVTKKDAGVNLSGLNPEMKKRLAGLAFEYNQKTGKKIQINSGYRDSKEQAELYAKYGPPRAAPPGRSRHESGLAVDINSTDANKAVELGLMAKYGFTRPVPGETWHVEPVESAKKGGTADNPFAPGAPVAVANAGGKPANPESGTKPPAGLLKTTAPAAMVADASTTAQPSSPPAASGLNQSGGTAPLTMTAEAVAPSAQPKQDTLGKTATRESAQYASNQVAMQAAPPPVVVNNTSGGSQQPITPPKTPMPKASPRSNESSFNRALAKDFAHPTAFTSAIVG